MEGHRSNLHHRHISFIIIAILSTWYHHHTETEMVGLTNPRARKRHHSADMTALPKGSISGGNRRSRSPSPHGRVLRSRSHRSGGMAGGAGTKNKSILPLFLPLLVFLGVFWIGLQAGPGDGRMPIHIDEDTESNLAVEAEEPAMQRGAALRGNVATGKVQQKNKADSNFDVQQSPERKAEGDQPLGVGQGVENLKEVKDPPSDDDDEPAIAAPPPDIPRETEQNVESTPQQTAEKITTEQNPSDTMSTEPPVLAHPTAPEKVLSIFLEPSNTLDESSKPLPPRRTSADILDKIEFPRVRSCADIPHKLPVNDFPGRDPFLPWLHDYFVSHDGATVQFVAGNKRRCETGKGKEVAMAYLQAQVSLFQPVPVAQIKAVNKTRTVQYRLAAPDDTDLVAVETRFQCRFHRNPGEEWITWSQYAFNYEYVHWRKRGNTIPMFDEVGTDLDRAELSQLQFSCPIPEELRKQKERGGREQEAATSFWLDVIPIRTPTRKNSMLLTSNHTGPRLFSEIKIFNASSSFGKEHILPTPENAGRWANLPVCLPDKPADNSPEAKSHTLVACTWASASYHRRGDDSLTFTDTARRLREWLHFNQLVGMDRVYLYDNTPQKNTTYFSPLEEIVKTEFADYVTHVRWPAEVCNANKLKDNNPGERSSQYAAEASCLERFGPSTKWMTFLDVDEYLIPRNNHLDWKPILAQRETPILGLRSARGRPRVDLMQKAEGGSSCEMNRAHFPDKAVDECLEPRSNETFLNVFNCDSFPPPRPAAFLKSKKQIIRPDFVLQHFVHNTTVTKQLATYYDQQGQNASAFTRELTLSEEFVDELTEGFLLHLRTVPSPETMMRSRNCQLGSAAPCLLGYQCPSTTTFNATLQRKNLLKTKDGKFCNCWVNPHIEKRVIPQLKAVLGHKPN